MNELAFLAVTTTGPDPHRNLLWEVSVVHRDVTFGGGDCEHQWQVRPPADHPDAAQVTGLAVGVGWAGCHIADPPTGLSYAELLFDIQRFLLDATIVAVDAARTMAFLRGLYARVVRGARTGWNWPPGSWPSGAWQIIDVASLVAGYLHGTRQHPDRPVDTSDLVTLLTGQTVPVGGSLARARWTRDLYDQVAGKPGEGR